MTETNETTLTLTPEETLRQLKETTVSKTDYEEAVNKYNALFNQVATGSFYAHETDDKPTEEELTQKFNDNVKVLHNNKGLSSREHARRLLEMDEYLVNHGQRSAFAPSSGDLTPDINNSVEKVREFLKSALEQSTSDEVFAAVIGNGLRD